MSDGATPIARRRRLSERLIPLAVIGALVAGAALASWAVVAVSPGAAGPGAAGSPPSSAAGRMLTAPGAEIASAAELLDDIREEQGWTTVTSGSDYIRGATATAERCGGFSCAAYDLTSEDGCAEGFRVQAEALAESVVVGRVHASSTAVAAGSGARVVLTDVTGLADAFRLAAARCAG